jgi:hypothetical protein
MSENGNKSLSDLRNLLQALAHQLDDSDDDHVATSRNNFGQMVAAYLVAVSASPQEQGKAAEIISQVQSMRVDQVRTALTVVDGLIAELAQGASVDYRKIQFPGIEEILG